MNNAQDTRALHISDIAARVNNLNLDDQILVFDTSFTAATTDRVPTYIDALIIILVTEGEGHIGIDLREYDVKKNSLIVLQPKNYLYLTVNSSFSAAHVIACSRHIIKTITPKLTDLLPALIHHRTDPVSQLSDAEAESLDAYYHFIRRQLNDTRGKFVRQKVQHLLQSALYELIDIYTTNTSEIHATKTRKDEIMARFIIEVSENFRSQRQVNYYADRLCISSKHLSAVVKTVSGMTAGEWIDNYVIMEAKVLLRTTDRTIQQISDNLNFKNQSFFGKYFKHLTGYTPTQYRRMPS